MTDELLEQARQGNRGALGRLLNRHRGALRAMAAHAIQHELGQEVDPSELVRQTLLQAHHGFSQFPGRSDQDWLQWLQSLMQANIASVIEHRRPGRRELARHEESFDVVDPSHDTRGSANQPTAVERSQQLRTLEAALDELPTLQSRAVRLRLMGNWNLARISQHLNMERPLVAGLLRRGIRTVRKAINPDSPSDP